MAVYRPENLLAISDSARKVSLKRHLKQDGPHGTDKCDYCNELAKDLGLLPDVVDIH